MQKLEVYQSLWAMQPHGPDGVKIPVADAFAMVADAGFDGMAIDLGVDDIATARATQPLFARHDLGCLIIAFPKTVESLREVLIMARDFGAIGVNVIGQVPALTLPEMIPVLRAWLEMSAEEGMPITFETHRNCITNDLYTTLELIDAIPEMRLTADLSHFLIDREFWYPISDFDQALISRILARSDSFQGRVASREQVQIPLAFARSQKWVALFEEWWREGFAGWRARNPSGTCNFLCELGPPEYAITGADGHELSNRWEEAQILKDRAHAIWRELGGSGQ